MQNEEKREIIGWPLSFFMASVLVCLWNMGLNKVVHFVDSEGYNYINVLFMVSFFGGMIYPQIKGVMNGNFLWKEFFVIVVFSFLKFCYVLLAVSSVYQIGRFYYFMHFMEVGKIAEKYRSCAMNNYCYEGIPSYVTYENCQERRGAWHIKKHVCLYFIDERFCQREDIGQWEDFGFCDK